MSTPLWITATPPAPSGELHIGHLAGPYVAADVLARFLRADGIPVLFTSGTADHAGSVELRALRTGRKPEEVSTGFHAAIAADWLRAGVRFDQLTKPERDRGYGRWMQKLLVTLDAEGALAARTRLLPHCTPCDRWLTGALVTGGCPHCGAASDGGMCRTCARPNDCGELLAPLCALCGTVPELRRCRRLYLPLEPFRERLADHWAAAELPPVIAALCADLLKDGLPDVAVGQPAEWGVPLPDLPIRSGSPDEGFPGHRIDPHFEAAVTQLFGYGYDKKALPERIIHFCGFGHAFGSAVLLPAVLLAQGVKLPQEFCVNEACRMDGARVTDGGERAVWALDLLTEYGSDTLRRHVMSHRPQSGGPDFAPEQLGRTKRVLEDTWNAWLTDLFAAVREECEGRVPAALPGGTGWEVQERRLTRAAEDLREAYGPEAFDPRRVLAVLDEVVRSVADFGHANTPEARHPHEAGQSRAARPSDEARQPHEGSLRMSALVAQLSVAAALTAWAGPVMPEGSDRLAEALRTTPGRAVDLTALVAPAPGTRLAPPSGPVFGF